jgi:hypothetical protein
MDTRYLSVAETAKLVRQALAEKFPGVKFSVRSKSYSGGASINVRWWDGPAVKQVEAIAKRFEGADFDGMIDLKTYHASMLHGERVHFGADFVFCDRKFTPPVFQAAVDHVYQQNTWPRRPEIVEDRGIAYLADGYNIFPAGEEYQPDRDFHTQLHRYLYTLSL